VPAVSGKPSEIGIRATRQTSDRTCRADMACFGRILVGGVPLQMLNAGSLSADDAVENDEEILRDGHCPPSRSPPAELIRWAVPTLHHLRSSAVYIALSTPGDPL